MPNPPGKPVRPTDEKLTATLVLIEEMQGVEGVRAFATKRRY
jgi:hypothetical protein